MERNKLEKEKNELIKTLRICEESVKKAPQGRLRIENNNGKHKYFHRVHSEDKKGKYIHKDEKKLAVALAQKEYDTMLINNISAQLAIKNKFETSYNAAIIQDTYNSLNGYRKELVDKRFKSNQEYAIEWQNEEYKRLPFDPNDDSDYYLDNGVRVRSKSEILIGNALIYRKIPFKYEKTIAFASGEWVSPDFTCLNVNTRKEIIWEHLGRMGEENYSNKNVKKIEKYNINGYKLGDNLIFTMETKEVQISTRVINKMIESFLY